MAAMQRPTMFGSITWMMRPIVGVMAGDAGRTGTAYRPRDDRGPGHWSRRCNDWREVTALRADARNADIGFAAWWDWSVSSSSCSTCMHQNADNAVKQEKREDDRQCDVERIIALT